MLLTPTVTMNTLRVNINRKDAWKAEPLTYSSADCTLRNALDADWLPAPTHLSTLDMESVRQSMQTRRDLVALGSHLATLREPQRGIPRAKRFPGSSQSRQSTRNRRSNESS